MEKPYIIRRYCYSIAEWKLREKLKETGESIQNQVKKQTQKPTLKWVFMLMRGITEVEVKTKSKTKSKTKIQVANVDEIKEKLIRLMPTFRRSPQKYHLFSQYGNNLKAISLSMNDSGQISKQIIHLCTSAECRIEGHMQL